MAKATIFHRQVAPRETPVSLGPLDDLIAVRLRRVDILLTAGFQVDRHLPTGVISCLGVIAGNPGISQKDLAQILGLDKSVVVSLMHALEQRGWAVRVQAEADRRRHELHATDQGHSQLAKIADDVRRFEDKMLADISVEELAHLRALLDRMHVSCIRNIE